MATELVRPTSAINTVWEDSTVTNIDDVVTQPTAPSGDQCSDSIQSGEQIWQCATGVGPGLSTTVKIWLYHEDDTAASESIGVRLKVNGSFLTGQTFQVGDNGAPLWTSNTFTTSTAVAGMVLQIAIDDSMMSKSNAIHLYCAYCEITYTPPAPDADEMAVMAPCRVMMSQP